MTACDDFDAEAVPVPRCWTPRPTDLARRVELVRAAACAHFRAPLIDVPASASR